jgi:hypothetical protein
MRGRKGPVRRVSLPSLVAAAALVVLPWALPGKAGAATQLGQVSPPFPLLAPSGNFVQLQTATIPYTVPSPGGVITGWSHMGSLQQNGKLKARAAITFTPTGGDPNTRRAKLKIKR